MNKYLLVFSICFLLDMLSHKVYNYYRIHRCDNSYHQVCIKKHTVIKYIMLPHMVGKVTTMQVYPIVHTICDEYKTELKEGCKK